MNNRTAVRKMVQMAKAHDDLDDLVYYVEMTLPQALRPRPDADKMAATFPPGWIPTIPLSPDSKAAEQWAHLLLEVLKDANEGRNILFRTALSSKLYMEELGLAFYEWGEPPQAMVDWICPACGMVERVFVGEQGTCCQPTQKRRRAAKACHPLPENAQFVGLHWWGGGDACADDLWVTVRHASPFTTEDDEQNG